MQLRQPLYLLIIISAVLFFFRLGSISLYQVAEARNAECAKEMYQNSNWIVPIFNGKLRTDKPALQYYAMMAAYAVGGVNEGNARFFSAFCGLLLIIATFLIVKRHAGKPAAWWSSLILLSSIHCIMQFRLATPDPFLILFNTLALYAFIEGWRSGKWKWYACMYLLLGLAVFAKGPVGLLLPGLILFVFLLIKRSLNWKYILSLKPWWGILLFALTALPWYILVYYKTNGAWTNEFFFHHNIGRFDSAIGGHGGIFLLTFVFVFVGMLPFSVFSYRAIRNFWKLRRDNDLLLFSFVTVCCFIGFYMVSRTKLINYTAPAYPFLAIMIGHYFSGLLNRPHKQKILQAEVIIIFVLSCAFPIGIYFFTQSRETLIPLAWVSWFFILFPTGTGIALFFHLKEKLTKSIYTIAITYMLATIVIFAYPYQFIDEHNAIKATAAHFKKEYKIIAYQSFNDAFVFYAGQPIPIMEDTLQLNDYLQTHQNVMILSRSRETPLLTHMPGIQLICKHRELFGLSFTTLFYKP